MSVEVRNGIAVCSGGSGGGGIVNGNEQNLLVESVGNNLVSTWKEINDKGIIYGNIDI